MNMDQNQQFQPQPPVFNQQAPQYQPPLAALPTLGFGEANKIFWRKSLDFTGRARRSEYWWGYLSVFIIILLWSFIATILAVMMVKGAINDMSDDDEIMRVFLPKLLLLYSPMLLLMVPVYAAMTRRLHDIGRSGWWIVANLLFSIIYVAGTFYMIFKGINYMDGSAELGYGFFAVLGVAYLATAVLGITIFVFTLLDSKPQENKYGPSPKYQIRH